MDAAFIALSLIVFAAYSVFAMAGFGAVVLALTLGSHLYPIDRLVPILVTLNLSLTTYIAIRHRAGIAWRLILTRVLPIMGAGAILGLLLANQLGGAGLQIVFGVFIVGVAVDALWRLRTQPTLEPLPSLVRAGFMFAAGIIHGIYASGGPLLVHALSRTALTKSELRSTLAAIWMTLNVGLVTTFFVTDRLGPDRLTVILKLLPVVVLATLFGEWAHARIDERRFRIALYLVLLVAGGSLLARTLLG